MKVKIKLSTLKYILQNIKIIIIRKNTPYFEENKPIFAFYESNR
jgi:hypothetical protein